MKPTVIITAALLCVLSPISHAKPLKVFILAGQSNMQGHADISTFDYVGKDPLTAPVLAAMRDAEGKPRVCDRVWISSLGCGGNQYPDMLEKTGKLTAGFGASDSKIGPEFSFGIYSEIMLKEPVFIIKTSWGGRSLNTDFRPPSAGQYQLPKAVQDVWDQHPQGAHGVPKLEDRKKWQEDKDAASGVFYRAMIEHVRKVTKDIKQVWPEYDEKAGFELAGFVWFQGFNDLVDGQTYPNGNYDEYSRLLSHFIRDVRKDLSAPRMPFVIGVLGVDGDKNVNFRKAMAAPADMPEFKGNVVAVDTAPFWDKDIEAAEPKQGAHRNTHHITVSGRHGFSIEQMNTEQPGPRQTDTNNAWQALVSDINDPENSGIGDINYWVVEGNVGAVEKFTKNGGALIRARRIGSAPDGPRK